MRGPWLPGAAHLPALAVIAASPTNQPPLLPSLLAPVRVGASASGGGVTLDTATFDARTARWTFRYTARNPAGRRHGVTQRVTLDASAPRGATTGAGGVAAGFDPRFEGDGTLEPDAPAGHIAMAVTTPPAPGWSAGVYRDGRIYWRADYDYETRRASYVRPGQAVSGFVVRATGVPLLRRAVLEPYAPTPRATADGDLVEGEYEPGTWKGAPLATLVPGPGLPAAAVTWDVVRRQVDAACGAALLAPPMCEALRLELSPPLGSSPGVAMRLAGRLTAGGAAHPWVTITLGEQLAALGARRGSVPQHSHAPPRR